ncbi:529_t:CDS:2, partial [Funneliformis caledonium]
FKYKANVTVYTTGELLLNSLKSLKSNITMTLLFHTMANIIHSDELGVNEILSMKQSGVGFQPQAQIESEPIRIQSALTMTRFSKGQNYLKMSTGKTIELQISGSDIIYALNMMIQDIPSGQQTFF